MTGSRVYLTAGGGEGIEAAYHLAFRYWNKSRPLGYSYGGGYKKQKLFLSGIATMTAHLSLY
ncbi:hypothetical protein J1614_011634 [Plenodomus biglobosus]|nr:hypothetical protein J1614_011634 [Plenodomus biglobosus]